MKISFDTPIYFIRHKFENDTRNSYALDFQNKNQIAIQLVGNEIKYWNNKSNNAQKSLKFKFIDYWFDILKSQDVLIVADYNTTKCKIGIFHKNNKIINDKNFKILQLSDCKDFDYSKYILLTIIRDRPGTISPVKSNIEYINCIFNKKEIPIKLECMHYKVQEQMCAEWLRIPEFAGDNAIQFQITPSGGSLADIDIYGVNNKGEMVIAQVTFQKYSTQNKSIIKKIDNLKKFENKHKILFALGENANIDGIDIISLENVFNDLNVGKTKSLIEAMIKLNLP